MSLRSSGSRSQSRIGSPLIAGLADQSLGFAEPGAVVHAPLVLDEDLQRPAGVVGQHQRAVVVVARQRSDSPPVEEHLRPVPHLVEGQDRGAGDLDPGPVDAEPRVVADVVGGLRPVPGGGPAARSVDEVPQRKGAGQRNFQFGRRGRRGGDVVLGKVRVPRKHLAEGPVLRRRVAGLVQGRVIVVAGHDGLVDALVVGPVAEAEVGAAMEHVDVHRRAAGKHGFEFPRGLLHARWCGGGRPSGRTIPPRIPST